MNSNSSASWHLATENCGPMETNSFLLWQGGEAVIIDPSINAEQLLQKMRDLQNEGVKLIAIWNTHGHIDHVYDNARWKAEFDVPIFCHQADHFFLEHLREQSLWFGLAEPEVVQPDELLGEGQVLRVGELEVEVIELPGHSPGSVAFAFDDHLISGDVIFQRSYGRVDLPGANAKHLARSLSRIFELPAHTQILCGHGAPTSVESESKNNNPARELMEQAS